MTLKEYTTNNRKAKQPKTGKAALTIRLHSTAEAVNLLRRLDDCQAVTCQTLWIVTDDLPRDETVQLTLHTDIETARKAVHKALGPLVVNRSFELKAAKGRGAKHL
jgi:Arc/MetJ family transcription regulator